MPRLDGVDVSAAQTITDTTLIPPLRFMAIQVGWSWEGDRAAGVMKLNSKLAAQRAVARALHLPVIWYFVPVGPEAATLDAQWSQWLAVIGNLGPNDSFMFDLEYPEARKHGRPALNALMDKARQHLGRPVFDYDFPDGLRQSPPWTIKWAAHYGTNPGSESERAVMLNRYSGIDVGMWQWAGATGRVSGFAGAVDCNEIIDQAAFLAATGGNVATGESHNPALMKAWTTDYKNRKVVRPRGIVAHTIVNSGDVTWQGFRAGAHGNDTTRAQYVDRDGTAVEIQPPDRKFICNWQGDEFVLGGVTYGHIPYETEDAPGDALGPYTPAQREALIKAWVEDCRMWNIPAVVPRVGDWTAPGIHYHSLHGLNTHHQTKPTSDPFGFNYYDSEHGYWVRVVNPLTKTVGKTCPGADKIAQHAEMVAEVARRLAGTPDVPPPEEDLTPTQAQQLQELWNHFSPTAPGPAAGANEGRGYWMLHTTRYGLGLDAVSPKLTDLAAAVAALTAKVDELAAAVAAIDVPDATPVVFPKYGPLPE